MDSQASGDQTSMAVTSKSYGNVTVGSGASAVLGDVSKDVNIHGGLHLHYPSPLEAIAVAGKVTEFLDVSDKLLRLGCWLEEPSTVPTDEDAKRLLDLLTNLSYSISQLGFTQDGGSNSETGPVQTQVITNSTNIK